MQTCHANLQSTLGLKDKPTSCEGYLLPGIINVGVVTIDVSNIGIKFEEFMQAGCRDQGSYRVLPKVHYSALKKYKQRFIPEKTLLYLTTALTT